MLHPINSVFNKAFKRLFSNLSRFRTIWIIYFIMNKGMATLNIAVTINCAIKNYRIDQA